MAIGLKIGDVVQLKSGGPEMTVEATGEAKPERWLCTWQDEHGNKRGAEFLDATLVQVSRGRR